MRLLLVSFAFPPFNSIGGVRVGKTAKYLFEHGHDVRVLASKEQPFKRTLPVELPSERVVYTRYLNVRKPAELVMGAGAQAAESNAAPPVSQGAQKGGGVAGAIKRAAGFLLRTFVYFPDSNVGWLPYTAWDSTPLLREWRPELILASSPPPTGLLAAWRLSRRLGVPWVADLRDLWVDHQYYSQPAWRKAVEDRLEREVLGSAAGLVTVSEPLAEKLRKKYGKPTAVVLNGFDPSDYPAAKDEAKDDEGDASHHPRANGDGRVTILYTGVIYPGRQDPSPLFDALSRLGPLADFVRVVFHGTFLGTARESAERYGVGRLVEVNPPVPYRESLRMQTEADVLLLLLWTDRAERGVYTGKMFEYVGARRPILAVGGNEDVAAEFVRERGAGVVENDPARIADILRGYVEEKRTSGRIRAVPEGASAGVTREEQVRVLEDFLSGLLPRAGVGAA